VTEGVLAFDADLLERVADDRPVSRGALADALERLQTTAERHIGVDGLVYDWRHAFENDPVLARHPDAYELVVEPRVWRDFADRCGFDEDALRAVMAVHARQVRRNAEARGEAPLPMGEPMLLVRGGGRS
jgi:hypothetical protein